jgi:hypothetical protein
LGCGALIPLFLSASAAYPWGAKELRFEANRGQTDADVAFLARGPGFLLLLKAGEAVLRLDECAYCAVAGPGLAEPIVRMRLDGAREASRLEAREELAGRTHYLRGHDPRRWLSGIRSYRKVVNRDVYPGIDLIYYSREGQLAFDLQVAPGADPGAIEVVFDGADSLELGEQGELDLDVGGRSLRVGRPWVYQETNGQRRPIATTYVATGRNRARFRIGGYDRSRLLTIDPVLRYSTYLGGAGDDFGRAVAVDEEGYVYVTGSTETLGLPGGEPGQGDAFVVKLDPRRSELVYATYLGGAAADMGRGVGVDRSGNAYIVGQTSSEDFPVVNPLQPSLRGIADAFVAKLDPAGATLVYSTYLGGSGFESARGMAVDHLGQVALMGQTISPDFPRMSAYQSQFGGAVDAFVAKLDASGTRLVFSTFLGGSGHDLPFHISGCGVPGDAPGWGLAVDGRGAVFVAGTTESEDFPTVNAFQTAHGGGLRDGFVSKFSPDGSVLEYSTYVGGSGGDTARGIAVDPFGKALVIGATRSDDFPVSGNALQSAKGALYDAFLVELDPSGSSLLYSTYLGGDQSDAGNAIALDAAGNPTLVGQTLSSNFPVLDPLQPAYGGGQDVFVSKFDRGGSLLYSTYLGGARQETPCGVNMGVAVDSIGTAYVAGATESNDFPVTANAAQGTRAGGFDAFVSEIRVEPEITIALEPEGAANRLVVNLVNYAANARILEVKLWLDLETGATFSLVPVPLSLSIPPGSTQVFNVRLPGFIAFPNATIGARLVEPDTGLVISESICSDSPCN